MQIKVDLKIFLFFLIFILTNKIKIYAIIMLFSLIHEIGHLLCGLFLGFKPEKMTLLPYGLKISFKTKCEDYNKKILYGNELSIKKILLALAGPITNMLCMVTAFLLYKNKIITNIEFYQNIIYSNMLIAIFNLLPIYPLDGGRITKEIIHIFKGLKLSYTYTQNISEICLYIVTAISSVLVLYYKNIAIIVIIVYLWYIVFKNKKEIKLREKLYENIQHLEKQEKVCLQAKNIRV